MHDGAEKRYHGAKKIYDGARTYEGARTEKICVHGAEGAKVAPEKMHDDGPEGAKDAPEKNSDYGAEEAYEDGPKWGKDGPGAGAVPLNSQGRAMRGTPMSQESPRNPTEPLSMLAIPSLNMRMIACMEPLFLLRCILILVL